MCLCTVHPPAEAQLCSLKISMYFLKPSCAPSNTHACELPAALLQHWRQQVRNDGLRLTRQVVDRRGQRPGLRAPADLLGAGLQVRGTVLENLAETTAQSAKKPQSAKRLPIAGDGT